MQSWALYFSKFIAAYEQSGINIWGLTIQNEPGKKNYQFCENETWIKQEDGHNFKIFLPNTCYEPFSGFLWIYAPYNDRISLFIRNEIVVYSTIEKLQILE